MIAAIVLAGGSGSRMGRSKPLIRLRDLPLLRHVIDHLKESTVDDIVVVLGYDSAAIRQAVSLEDVSVVENPEYAKGMSTSIRAGLRAVKDDAEAALIVLADQPLISSKTVNRLVDFFRDRKPAIVVPAFRGFRGNPVLIARRLFPEMSRITGDIGCRAIFDDHPADIETVEVDDPGVLIDIDTPEDLERAIRLSLQSEAMGKNNPPHLHQEGVQESSKLHATVQVGSVEPIFAKAYELSSKEEPFAMATVVRVVPPTSAKPGSKALVLNGGKLFGWVGGVCSQSSVIEQGLAALSDGKPRFISISTGGELNESRHGVISVPMKCYSGGTMDIYIEPHLPQPRLLVIGHEPIAAALTRLGKAMGLAVHVVDPLATQQDFPDAERVYNDPESPDIKITPHTFVVVATHGRFDERSLERFLKTDTPYVALVASRKRAAVIVDHLAAKGIPAERLRKIKNPAGLDIGAVTPEEIAVSIVAEIVGIRRKLTTAVSASEVSSTQVGGTLVEAPASPTTASYATDPVCGMTVDAVHPAAKAEYGGRTYFFCCEGCADKFLASPHAYVKN